MLNVQDLGFDPASRVENVCLSLLKGDPFGPKEKGMAG